MKLFLFKEIELSYTRIFNKKYTIINLLFILSGTKFYMDWILPTNPASKNPIIKFLISPLKFAYSVTNNLKGRFYQSFIFISIHLFFFVLYILQETGLLLNLLFNIYPIIINLYIAYRIKLILNFRKIKNENMFFTTKKRYIKEINF